jgi:hypothetical protein
MVGTNSNPFLTMRLLITRERFEIVLELIIELHYLHNISKYVLSNFLL